MNGLPIDQFNYNSGYQDRIGNIYFGSLLSLIHIYDDLTEEPPGPVHNENISIGSGNPELILAWKENTGYTVTIAGWGQKMCIRDRRESYR